MEPAAALPVVDALPVLPSESAAAPVADSERIVLLDILRGLAVFGILLVNIGAYAHPFEVRMPEPAPGDVGSQVALWLTRAFVEGKFYPLFSMLFGLGLALQMDRAVRTGRDGFSRLYMRRLLVLAGIGLFHGLFIWAGDVLFTYALLGFVLLALRHARPRTHLLLAAFLLGAPFLLCGAGAGVLAAVLSAATDRAPIEKITGAMTGEVTAAYSAYAGTFGQVALKRAKDWFSLQAQSPVAMTSILAMFLIGLWAGRRGLAAAPSQHLPFLRKAAWIGMGVGLPAAFLYASLVGPPIELLTHPQTVFAIGMNFVTGAVLAIGYAATVTLWLQRAGAGSLLRFFAPAGRMALTNYLAQSVICTFVFYGYGLGLFGKTTALTGALTAVTVVAFQLFLSHWWLRRYRFGPVEWLWRSLTYGARQPMRRVSASP